MRGLELSGGSPRRWSSDCWVDGVYRDLNRDKKPGDTIEVKSDDGTTTESGTVVDAPNSWYEACISEAADYDRDGWDWTMLTADAFIAVPGDCIHDRITINNGFNTKFPYMRWCIIQRHLDNADLLFIVPLMECDPYGRVTDPDYKHFADRLGPGVFAEDTNGQDHVVAYWGNGEWIHRDELVGINRDLSRDHVVSPVRKKLIELVSFK